MSKTRSSAEYRITRTLLINDFAFRSFLQNGDRDYIAARASYKAKLPYPATWLSQQAIEKWLKCILLLNRIPATKVRHSLGLAMDAINTSGKVQLGLTPVTSAFIKKLEQFGEFRYLEVSYTSETEDLIRLDRAAWELRRFCTFDPEPQKLQLESGKVAPKYKLDNGALEEILSDKGHPARETILWKNCFTGVRRYKRLTLDAWMHASNAPLYMHPEILDELLKYVFLPGHLAKEWRKHKAPDGEITEP